MPHDKIYAQDSTPEAANCVQVAWGHPSSPSNTGPGHGNGTGHVMVIVERPGTPARMAASVEHTRERLAEMVLTIAKATVDGTVDDVVGVLMDRWGEDLSYAFGGPCELLAVSLDRDACNATIAAVRRGRNAAFGRDE
jgi:hypothetical protein